MNPIDNEVIIELNDFLRHILPLIWSFSEFEDFTEQDLLLYLLEIGAEIQHPYFMMYKDKFDKIIPCSNKSRLKLSKP